MPLSISNKKNIREDDTDALLFSMPPLLEKDQVQTSHQTTTP
jgi:hypothetical protein